MQQIISRTPDARMRRAYDTAPAHLLIIAPTERELGTMFSSRAAGIGVATVGVGRVAADRLKLVFDARRPQIALSIGFGGALTPNLATGDIVISLYASSIQVPDKQIAFDSDYSIAVFNTLTDAGFSPTYGDVLMVPEPLLKGREKLLHGIQTQSAIVDMESYWIAQESLRVNIPMVSIRVILDEMTHELPDLVTAITADGGQNEWKHALRAMLKPSSAGSLLPLAMRSRKAAAVIKAALQAVIPTLTKGASLRAMYR